MLEPYFCPESGNELISKNAEICPNCGVRLRGGSGKSPGIAALCSFLFPGLGQVYNGDVGRGFLILLGTIVGSLYFLIPGLAVFNYGIYDAYATAKRMNAGEIPSREATALHMVLFVVLWFVGIAALFLMAAIAAFTFGVAGAY